MEKPNGSGFGFGRNPDQCQNPMFPSLFQLRSSRYDVWPDRRGNESRIETTMQPQTAGVATTGKSKTGRPAGYGQSCTNCSKAKCRCMLRADGEADGGCERCYRLDKSCERIVANRKRTQKRSASSRTAQLEEKLQDLVSILRASQHPGQQGVDAASLAQSSSSSSPSQSLLHQLPPSRLDSLVEAATANTASTKTRQKAPPPPPLFCMDQPACADNTAVPSAVNAYTRAEPTLEEAEVYLAKFRDWLKNFPFMHLPADLTASALRQSRPILWLSIMNMTSMSLPQQHLLRSKFRQEIAERMIFNHERSMDLLLGLIAYLVWATMNTGPSTKPFLILYAQLAAAVLFDMGLTRSPNEEQQSGLYLKVWNLRPTPAPKTRTLEECRAVLAFWFCTSTCTSFIGKMETLNWTSHMDECLALLEHEREQPLDEVLVAIIKSQLVGEEAQKLLRLQGATDAGQGPSFIYKTGLINRLDRLKQSLPAALHFHYLVRSQLYAIEASVHSIGLFTDQPIPEAARTSSMYACTKAASSWYSAFFSVPLIDVPGLPFAVYVSMSHMQAILYRLTTSTDANWDKEILRSGADLLVLLDKTIDVFGNIAQVYQLRTDDSDGTLFTKGARILRNVRSFWEPELSQHLRGANLPTPNSQTGLAMSSNLAVLEPKLVAANDSSVQADAAAVAYELNDLTWMTDIFGPWEL
ncbi:hypothetical protein DCS_03939 [Drechmeria coniospora]|uniref:Zn(2)-C6 fungal-type domain-containing protein n=1 Tax=Drechmeria coniospora TaxID=98403 RepID=A0A151GII6_DRECN|nr:hypothetical protein DCS_03939 [Drechmeria coniospora]KYK56933.1 hypothetical protein DCS_03939 [Drechmeria coniospora]